MKKNSKIIIGTYTLLYMTWIIIAGGYVLNQHCIMEGTCWFWMHYKVCIDLLKEKDFI